MEEYSFQTPTIIPSGCPKRFRDQVSLCNRVDLKQIDGALAELFAELVDRSAGQIFLLLQELSVGVFNDRQQTVRKIDQ